MTLLLQRHGDCVVGFPPVRPACEQAFRCGGHIPPAQVLFDLDIETESHELANQHIK
jgi:hypothetical protein